MVYRLSLALCFVLGLSGLGSEPGEPTAPKKQPEKAERPANPQPLAKPLATEPTVQILFNRPERAKVYWDATKVGAFDSSGLSIPGRQTFLANALFRLRLTDISGYKGDEFFPTLEIGPFIPRNEKFLLANAIPVQFRSEDLDRASRGEAVTKVVYLPDEEFAELAAPGGVDTLVSFLLDPGVDPVTEADRRGVILAIVRLSDVKLAARPAEAVAASPKIEPTTVAEPVGSSWRAYRNRRGWLRRR